MSKTNALLTRIAQTKLRIETLEARGSDRLDFHDLSVESLRDALEAAYNAGIEQGRKATPAEKSTDSSSTSQTEHKVLGFHCEQRVHVTTKPRNHRNAYITCPNSPGAR